MHVGSCGLLHSALVLTVLIGLDPAGLVQLLLEILQADLDKSGAVNERRARLQLVLVQVFEYLEIYSFINTFSATGAVKTRTTGF